MVIRKMNLAIGILMAAFGLALQANAASTNVALSSNGGVATQSSTLGTPGNDGFLQVASRAIDGDTNGNWFTGKITHTNNEFQPWWQVSLGGGISTISEIDIWNRTDCCTGRLNHYDVTVFSGGVAVWSSLNNPTPALQEAIFLPTVAGDAVKIQLEGSDYLSLAEVQVWTTSAVPEPETYAMLLAGLGLLGVAAGRRKQS